MTVVVQGAHLNFSSFYQSRLANRKAVSEGIVHVDLPLFRQSVSIPLNLHYI